MSRGLYYLTTLNFVLFGSILLNKWRYFYKLPRPATVAVTEELNRKEIFETILGLILESFSESDISIYRNNLQAVEEINTKWNLYEKVSFLSLQKMWNESLY